MHRGLRLLAAGVALIVVLDGAVLLARAGDDEAKEADVLGVQFGRTTTTPPTTVPSSATTLVGAAPEPPTTGSVPIIEEGGSTTTDVPAGSRPGRPSTTTTTGASSEPRQVTERSDNSATFMYGPGSGATVNTVPPDPSDPFRFLVSGQDGNQDGTAELRADMANQTQRDMAFPGGLVLLFNLTKDGRFWRTVELRFPDVQSLPARGSLEVESAVPLDGPGRYEVVGEVRVEYR